MGPNRCYIPVWLIGFIGQVWVMIALTRKADYALIALSHLARSPEQVFSSREIAARYGAPQSTLTNIMKRLTRAGILVSERGARGGYGLARPAERISLYNVIEAVDGPPSLVQCVSGTDLSEPGRCEIAETCPIQRPVRRIHERLVGWLREVTLADIARSAEEEMICDITMSPVSADYAAQELAG